MVADPFYTVMRDSPRISSGTLSNRSDRFRLHKQKSRGRNTGVIKRNEKGLLDGPLKSVRIRPPLRGLANTLTLILDTDGNVFRGFKPVEGKSHMWNEKKGNKNNCVKGNDSGQCVCFRVRDPCGVWVWKFALRQEKRQSAISYSSAWSPFLENNSRLLSATSPTLKLI
jgi:hypothetical protein